MLWAQKILMCNKRMKYLLLIVTQLLILSGCEKNNSPLTMTERPALTVVVGENSHDSGATYSGEVRARYETQLGFRLGGKIIERLVEPGTHVKTGQPLMRLDAEDAGLQLGSTEAQFNLSEAELKRYRDLYAKGYISKSALDSKEANFKSLLAQKGLARNQQGYTTLYADHGGIITATLAEVGQGVAPLQPVVKMALDGEREIAISIPETHLSNMKIGLKADVTLISTPVPLLGHLREISPIADPASRTYTARIVLSHSSSDVALGMTARVHFASTTKSVGICIPLTALYQQGKQTAVWIVAANHTVSLRPVQVESYRDEGAIISSGLVEGERIVSNGVHRLADKEKIRILESKPAQ
jgi:RND family efflux transporter MFP subunit